MAVVCCSTHLYPPTHLLHMTGEQAGPSRRATAAADDGAQVATAGELRKVDEKVSS